MTTNTPSVVEALRACADNLERYLNGIGLEHDHPGEVALDNARQAIAALEQGGGDPRVLDAATGSLVPGPRTRGVVGESFTLHHATSAALNGFMFALAEKLSAAERKYGYSDGWKTQEWEDECRRHLHQHVEKGDPLDVAAYAMFCWARGWSTASAQPEPGREEIGRAAINADPPPGGEWGIDELRAFELGKRAASDAVLALLSSAKDG